MVFSVLIKKIVLPRSTNQDTARKEFILNVLLIGSMTLTIVAFLNVLAAYILHFETPDATAPQIIFFFFLFLAFLLYLSRKGKTHLAALALIFFLYISGLYTSVKWGADVTQAWLIYALIIVMSGILIGTRFAFFLTLSIVLALSLLGYLQLSNFYKPSVSWRMQEYTFGDTVLLNISLVVISVLAWLSNREIEKSLKRARASEKELKQERDLLEIKVEERTRELKKTQLEKMTQLYRFAEIGRLTGGFFHDFVNPLSLVSLNLHKLNRESQQKEMAHINKLLKRALIGTKHLEDFVITARKQLQNQDIRQTFSVTFETKQVIQMLRHKADKANVKILFAVPKPIRTFGNPIKFNQIATNLILNAIDSYTDSKNKTAKRVIKITLEVIKGNISFRVLDFGSVITQENMKQIFEPFFTTKSADKGTGLGLSITRDIVQQNFLGKITVKSTEKDGTLFTVIFPLSYPRIKQRHETS